MRAWSLPGEPGPGTGGVFGEAGLLSGTPWLTATHSVCLTLAPPPGASVPADVMRDSATLRMWFTATDRLRDVIPATGALGWPQSVLIGFHRICCARPSWWPMPLHKCLAVVPMPDAHSGAQDSLLALNSGVTPDRLRGPTRRGSGDRTSQTPARPASSLLC